jgi:hypothetical protein
MLDHRRTLFVVLLLLAASILACQIPFGLGGGTEATPTPLPQPTPTVPSWPLVLTEDFSDPESGAYVDSDETRRYFYQDGYYGIEILKEDWSNWSWWGDVFSDFMLEVDLTPQGEGGQGGVIFRMVEEQQFYHFTITPDGRYRLQKRVSEENWEMLLDWTESAHIRTGGVTNRLRVVCLGPTISLYVNDQYLYTAQDTSHTEGKIGLTAGTFEGEPYNLVHFDNLGVYAATATVPPTATPVQVSPMPTLPSWPVVLTDDFDDSESGFSQDSNETRRFFYQAGQYGIEVTRESWIAFTTQGDFSDLVMEIDVISQEEAGEAGVVFRREGDYQAYFFVITPEGQYSLQKSVAEGEGRWDKILDWTGSPHIIKGLATNRLRVVCVGSTISLYVNEQYLDTAQDETYTEGKIGMAVGTFEGETHALFYFDNLRVYAPGPTIETTATPMPQVTATPVLPPTPTPVLGTPTVPSWSLAVSDDFSDPKSGFRKSSDENRRLFYEDGRYGIEVLKEEWIATSCLSDLSDFMMEVDVISTGESGRAGIIFREGGERAFYFFAITPEGWYKLWKRVSPEEGGWERILDWQQSPHVNKGAATNRLQVVCVGSTISLYINDQYLDTAQDATYTEGRVCMAAGTFIGENNALFYFDNLQVYTP